MDVADDVGHVARLIAGSDCRLLYRIDYKGAVWIPISKPPAFVDVDVLVALFLQTR